VKQKKNSANCELCGRARDLTFHHLIPRKLHKRRRFKKLYSREQLNQGIYLCRLCHNGLHRLYNEEALAKLFNDKQKIMADPVLIKHIDWSAKQKLVRFSIRE